MRICFPADTSRPEPDDACREFGSGTAETWKRFGRSGIPAVRSAGSMQSANGRAVIIAAADNLCRYLPTPIPDNSAGQPMRCGAGRGNRLRTVRAGRPGVESWLDSPSHHSAGTHAAWAVDRMKSTERPDEDVRAGEQPDAFGGRCRPPRNTACPVLAPV